MTIRPSTDVNDKDDELTLHVCKLARPECEHEWDNDGCNPERCLKCGLSFMSYVFTECP